jgi:hypothetical protein
MVKSVTVLVLLSLLAPASECLAARPGTQSLSDAEREAKLKRDLSEAKAKGKWLRIRLKNGGSITGKVDGVSEKDFVLTAARRRVAASSPKIEFAQVASSKQMTHSEKVLSDLGRTAFEGLFVVALILPLGIPYAILCSIRGIRC